MACFIPFFKHWGESWYWDKEKDTPSCLWCDTKTLACTFLKVFKKHAIKGFQTWTVSLILLEEHRGMQSWFWCRFWQCENVLTSTKCGQSRRPFTQREAFSGKKQNKTKNKKRLNKLIKNRSFFQWTHTISSLRSGSSPWFFVKIFKQRYCQWSLDGCVCLRACVR